MNMMNEVPEIKKPDNVQDILNRIKTIQRKDTIKKSDIITSEGAGGASSDFYEPDFEDQTSNSQNVKGVLSSIGQKTFSKDFNIVGKNPS
jgi:hypothetical protein